MVITIMMMLLMVSIITRDLSGYGLLDSFWSPSWFSNHTKTKKKRCRTPWNGFYLIKSTYWPTDGKVYQSWPTHMVHIVLVLALPKHGQFQRLLMHSEIYTTFSEIVWIQRTSNDLIFEMPNRMNLISWRRKLI